MKSKTNIEPIEISEQDKNNISKPRRRVISGLSSVGVIGALGILDPNGQWMRPVIKAVVLPAHAQTSVETPTEENVLSCSGTILGNPIADGDLASATDAVMLTVTTEPPEPNGLFTINGLCDGVVVSTSVNNLLDGNGQFTFPLDDTICLPQASSASFGARFTLQSNDDVTECNYLIPEPLTTFSCSAVNLSDQVIPEGGTASTVVLTLSTTPTLPNELITIQLLCDGAPTNPPSVDNFLDGGGELNFTLPQTFCSSQAGFTTYGVRFILQSDTSVVLDCNFAAVQVGTG